MNASPSNYSVTLSPSAEYRSTLKQPLHDAPADFQRQQENYMTRMMSGTTMLVTARQTMTAVKSRYRLP